jgi:hypothetical protein
MVERPAVNPQELESTMDFRKKRGVWCKLCGGPCERTDFLYAGHRGWRCPKCKTVQLEKDTITSEKSTGTESGTSGAEDDTSEDGSSTSAPSRRLFLKKLVVGFVGLSMPWMPSGSSAEKIDAVFIGGNLPGKTDVAQAWVNAFVAQQERVRKWISAEWERQMLREP